MSRSRAVKTQSGVLRKSRSQDLPVEQDLTPPEVLGNEQDMAKQKLDPAVRKTKLEREVQFAFESVAAMRARPKKRGKKSFPATPLQKRMQSGGI